jgi:hypothetical protein
MNVVIAVGSTVLMVMVATGRLPLHRRRSRERDREEVGTAHERYQPRLLTPPDGATQGK